MQAPQTKEELIRELQQQRAAEEAASAAKKKSEEQRLAVKFQLALPNPMIFSSISGGEKEIDRTEKSGYS